MAKYTIEDTTLINIANSIRSKTGSTEGIYPTDMASAIDGITVGSDYDIIEDLEIDLDLSEGNQILYAPDGSLVKSAIIKKPETLLPENIAKDIEIAGVIGTFEGSGGSVEGFATVTFMNGNTEIYSRPVYIGDDCPDPVTQGRIEAPTKESTAQYDYTYNGWSSANGGTANSNILKNIQADTVVYSAYSSTVRKYTITYYDEDGTTVLHTEQVAYGVVPSYAPTKEGVAFDKWTPTPTAVAGNASYTASWSTVIASGTCGTNVNWRLTPDYNMIIAGEGAMEDYSSAPWGSYKSQIVSADIQSGVTSIGNCAFQNCSNLASVTISNSVTSIGECAFWGTSITNIIIPNSVINIGERAFLQCSKLTSIIIPNSVTSLEWALFSDCSSLESCIIPDSVTSIGNAVFGGCTSLTSIIIPDSVTSISINTFRRCTSLTSIIIPDSVTSIGDYAFRDCSNLADIYYSGSEENKADITIGTFNEFLTNATWHYNYTA